MLQIDGKKIEGIYYGENKIDRYYFNGVMYEFYKPYIDYKWSDTITINNSREIKNSGSFNQDLQLFYGQGVKFNGVDEGILETQIEERGNIGSICIIVSNISVSRNRYIYASSSTTERFYLRVNSTNHIEIGMGNNFLNSQISLLDSPIPLVITWNNGFYTMYYNGLRFDGTYAGVVDVSNLTIGRSNIFTISYFNGILSNIFLTSEMLSETQRSVYINKPEDFIYREDNTLKSNCGLDISKVIAWFPMCEKDNYIRDEKNYLEKEKTVDIHNTSFTSASPYNRIAQQNIGLMLEANKTYEIVYDFLPNANFVEFKLYIPPTSNGGTTVVVAIPVSSFPGRYILRVPSTYSQTNGITSCYMWIEVNGNETTHLFKEISLKEITGIYPINNYTAGSRLNARRLTSGLQTCFLNRDSLGRYLSINKDGLVGDGVGYASTRYISPLNIVPETIEAIIVKPKTIQTSFNKYVCGGGGSSDMVIEISANTNINGYIRMRKVGRPFQAQHWLPTDVMYIAVVCDGINSMVYINGVLSGTYTAQSYTSSQQFKLGIEHRSTGSVVDNRGIDTGKIRLFRVHQKALTGNDVLSNFNKYESKGLLAETYVPDSPVIEVIPNGAIMDIDGNYLLDPDGNYLIIGD